MPTARQDLGDRGEKAVAQHVPCPRCYKARHLTRLPKNFQCADVICRFCGYLAQVKAVSLAEGATELPDRILGAAWGPQHEQIMAGIYHGLYIAGFTPKGRLVRIDFVPPHVLQASPQVFEPRRPLSTNAKRAGWQGFIYNLTKLPKIGISHHGYPGGVLAVRRDGRLDEPNADEAVDAGRDGQLAGWLPPQNLSQVQVEVGERLKEAFGMTEPNAGEAGSVGGQRAHALRENR